METFRKNAALVFFFVSLFFLSTSLAANAQTGSPPVIEASPVPTIDRSVFSGSNGEYYCLTNVGNRPNNGRCTDESDFEVRKGVGGVTGRCGTVIEWNQRIMESLQQISGKGLWDTVSTQFTSCSYVRAPFISGYMSTNGIVDAYNLAGFREMSMSTHTDGAYMAAWWQSPAATTAGYTWVEYPGGSAQNALRSIAPGYVMFIGYHAAIVNAVDIDSRGNGWISVLHPNTTYWLTVFPVFNWNILNTPSEVLGFGGR
jgi:hypothetical protein